MSSVTLFALILLLAGPSCASALESPSNAGNVSLEKRLRGVSDTVSEYDWIDDERLLQSSTYVDPSWWQQYKDANGKHFKRCKFQENVAPLSGTVCRRMRVGDYTCMFGDQTCPDGSTHPAITCDCIGNGGGIWDCEELKVCEPAPEPVTTCPSEHPVTFNPPLTCSGDLTCAIGQQKCCGDTFPMYECTCKNGVFDCKDDRSCDKRVCPLPGDCPIDSSNPIKPPEDGSSCALQPEETCVYDETCCRDTCAPRFTCSCVDGQWFCPELHISCPEPVTDFPSFAPSSATPEETCPVIPGPNKPPPQQGSSCSLSADIFDCAYDEVCCPNNSVCLSRTFCSCENGKWDCSSVNLHPCSGETAVPSAAPSESPAPPEETTCPVIPGPNKPPPQQGSSCSLSADIFDCAYDEVCCPNNSVCLSRTFCSCENGKWDCSSVNLHPCSGETAVPSAAPSESTAPPEETKCPVIPGPNKPPPQQGSSCSLSPDIFSCAYDEVCCPNNSVCPFRTFCRCENGEWDCNSILVTPCSTATAFPSAAPNTDACPVDPTGQDIPPEIDSDCEIDPDESCKYGETCCFFRCTEQSRCSCQGSKWECKDMTIADCPFGSVP